MVHTESSFMRRTLDYSTFSIWTGGNTTGNGTDFDANLVRPQDVSVDAVVTSLYFNAVVFILLMAFYEFLRRFFPAVYSSRKRLTHILAEQDSFASSSGEKNVESSHDAEQYSYLPPRLFSKTNGMDSSRDVSSSLASLPDDLPLDWVAPVFGVPWQKVRKTAGLDGYFFLRYIRMNIRITAVSSFWFFLILVPIYATGAGNPQFPAQGWYHISASNLPSDGWRMWAPVVFAYLFSGFIFFVIKQEYKHFLELRQDFLAKGSTHVNPQHHYSLMIEDIPFDLRSSNALTEYFENMFPGKVHSASIILKLPDLEDASTSCTRVCRRLEKSIAYLQATGKRPSHVVGQTRLRVLGIDLNPIECCRCCCDDDQDIEYFDDDHLAERPAKGVRVDSISYYTQDLAARSRSLFRLQKLKENIADTGNHSLRAETWFDKIVLEVEAAADLIMGDSILDNDLILPADSKDGDIAFLHAENMTSRYGSISPSTLPYLRPQTSAVSEKKSRLLSDSHQQHVKTEPNNAPFSSGEYSSRWRRWAGRLGLDFVVAIFRFLNKQLDVALSGVLSSTMSSTGFVTFLDLTSTTCAASALLSAKASVLNVSVAPEPREIIWENCHVSRMTRKGRERVVNFLLFLGVILWSFPLAFIQVVARAQNIAQIPGMEWILTFREGAFMRLINGYLPVVALLGIIMLLPVLFEYIAVHVESRKTLSDVQSSMVTRYFYYQLANIYITVTAGSILRSMADILDHPGNILPLLGESLPSMVGYFIALLVTKIMAGLPMIFLRFGALARMLILQYISDEKKLTQREIDAIYRLENIQYGWEFPTQLLVVVIVFTYAIICPIILPFGLVYFLGALVVYKKQILYVYSPVYESGGAMFPLAVQRTLFGLVCGQMTLLGYTVTRSCYYQNFALLPLPILTVITMRNYYESYAIPSNRLSLERAREYDRLTSLRAADKAHLPSDSLDVGLRLRERQFDKNAYRQPVLTELPMEPWTYRRGVDDEETMNVRQRLRHINRFVAMQQSSDLLSP